MKTDILLVDDEMIIRSALKRNLNKTGYQTDTASNGQEALELIEKNPYKLLITDYLMEGINGVELIMEAKKRQPGLKIIVFSGYATEDLPVDSLSNGADCFLHKPLSLNELIENIDKLIG